MILLQEMVYYHPLREKEMGSGFLVAETGRCLLEKGKAGFPQVAGMDHLMTEKIHQTDVMENDCLKELEEILRKTALNLEMTETLS